MTARKKPGARRRSAAAKKAAATRRAKSAGQSSTVDKPRSSAAPSVEFNLRPDPSVTAELVDAGEVPEPGEPIETVEPPDSAGSSRSSADEVTPPLMSPNHWTSGRCEFYLRQLVNPALKNLDKPELTIDELAEGSVILAECIRRLLGALDSPWIAIVLWAGVVFGSRYAWELMQLVAKSRFGAQLGAWILQLKQRRQIETETDGAVGV
jgi:hypothetical protein